MDTDLLTSGAAAAELRTSVARVLRAARSGLAPSQRRGNRTLFTRATVEQLRRVWGWAPEVAELSREETFVLAALSRRPRGLRSIRAVARAAGVSPTTAADALSRLAQDGLVDRRAVREVTGRVNDASVWAIRWASPPWRAVARQVAGVVLPEAEQRRDVRVPDRLAHLFWNQDVRDLHIADHAVLIADRILRSLDPEGLAWAVKHLPRTALAHAARKRGLDARTRTLAQRLAVADAPAR